MAGAPTAQPVAEIEINSIKTALSWSMFSQHVGRKPFLARGDHGNFIGSGALMLLYRSLCMSFGIGTVIGLLMVLALS